MLRASKPVIARSRVRDLTPSFAAQTTDYIIISIVSAQTLSITILCSFMFFYKPTSCSQQILHYLRKCHILHRSPTARSGTILASAGVLHPGLASLIFHFCLKFMITLLRHSNLFLKIGLCWFWAYNDVIDAWNLMSTENDKRTRFSHYNLVNLV